MLNNFQRYLDEFIEGRHDSRHPANQIDWAEEYAPILEKCAFITEAMLDNEEIYCSLGGVFSDVIEPYFSHKHFTNKERSEFMQLHAVDMSEKINTLWRTRPTKDKK